MKGVAIFLMVMGHILIFSFGIHHSPVQSMFLSNMPIFFYVSGYLGYREIRSWSELGHRLAKRCWRLMIPWLFITSAMTIWGQRHFWETLTEFYWFFYVLLLITIAFTIWEFAVARSLDNPILSIVSYAVPIAVLVCGKALPISNGLMLPYGQIFMYSFPYLVGLSCRKYIRLNSFVLNNPILFVVSAVAFVYGWYCNDEMNIVVRIIAGLGGIIVLQSFFYHREMEGKHSLFDGIFIKMGVSSLSIYMLNNFFIPNLEGLLGSEVLFVGNGFLWQFSLVALLTVIVTSACIVIKTILEHNKYLKHVFC